MVTEIGRDENKAEIVVPAESEIETSICPYLYDTRCIDPTDDMLPIGCPPEDHKTCPYYIDIKNGK